MDYTFDFFEGRDGQTYLNIKHVNGQTLYTSEGYTTRQAAIETLQNFIRGLRALYRSPATIDEIIAKHSVTSTEVQS